jgi:hypothetical protein
VPRSRAGAAALLVPLAVGCSGGSRAVEVAHLPSAGPATTRFCDRVQAGLPDRLGDLERRAVDTDRAAAWGVPPVVLRCGVAPLVRPPGDTARVEVNGVAWYPDAGDGATTWTTLELPVPVEVFVPEEHEGQLIAGLSPALRAART